MSRSMPFARVVGLAMTCLAAGSACAQTSATLTTTTPELEQTYCGSSEHRVYIRAQYRSLPDGDVLVTGHSSADGRTGWKPFRDYLYKRNR